MPHSMSNSASIRWTASGAIGEITCGVRRWAVRRAAVSMSANLKNFAAHGPSMTFRDRPWLSLGFVQLAIPTKGIRLQDAAVGGQMALGMSPERSREKKISASGGAWPPNGRSSHT